MMSRQNYEMSEAQLAKLLAACRSVPLIATHCGPIRSPQENANDAWRELGKEMGFKWDTAEPTSRGDRYFSAEPCEVTP
jgi:hypothetical protein